MLDRIRSFLPAEALRQALEQDLAAGLEAAAILATNPFQRWAAGRALADFVAAHPGQFFPTFDQLLRHPTPYYAVSIAPQELARAADPHFNTQLLLAELSGLPPTDGLVERLARFITAPLRRATPEPLQSLAQIYYAWLLADELDTQELLVLLSLSLEALAACMWDQLGRPSDQPEAQNQHARFWVEVCQGFRTWHRFLSYETKEDLALAPEQVTWADDCDAPLRSDVLAVLTSLAQIGSSLDGAGLDQVAAQAEQLPPPESTLAAAVSARWAKITSAP